MREIFWTSTVDRIWMPWDNNSPEEIMQNRWGKGSSESKELTRGCCGWVMLQKVSKQSWAI